MPTITAPVSNDNPSFTRAKLAVRGLYDTQKLRIQLQLRIAGLVRDGKMKEKEAKAFFKLPFEQFEAAEKAMEKLVWREVKDWPIVSQWLIRINGIGPRLSGLLVANIGDIKRFDSVGKLNAYSGMHLTATVFFKDLLPNGKNRTIECLDAQYQDREHGQVVVIKRLRKIKPIPKPEDTEDDIEEKEVLETIVQDRVEVFEVDANTVWRIDRHAAKARKGEKSNWNRELQTTLWKAAGSFVKLGGPYRRLYDSYKTRITEREMTKGNIIWGIADVEVGTEQDESGAFVSQKKKKVMPVHFDARKVTPPDRPPADPEWTLSRIDNMAKRYIAKMFLSNLWEAWRTIEGLPVRLPYSHEYLGHSTAITPWEMMEPETPKK